MEIPAVGTTGTRPFEIKESIRMLDVLTAVHVLISLGGILTGFLVVAGFIRGRKQVSVTQWFLATTFLTSATGFLFPFHGVTPGIVVGILSIIILGLAVFTRRSADRPWSRTFVVGSVIALYFNVFVLVVQLFEKVPALHALAPTQSEPPFAIAQLAVLLTFIALGVLAVKGDRKVTPIPA
jgi:hypothetical protein